MGDLGLCAWVVVGGLCAGVGVGDEFMCRGGVGDGFMCRGGGRGWAVCRGGGGGLCAGVRVGDGFLCRGGGRGRAVCRGRGGGDCVQGWDWDPRHRARVTRKGPPWESVWGEGLRLSVPRGVLRGLRLRPGTPAASPGLS